MIDLRTIFFILYPAAVDTYHIRVEWKANRALKERNKWSRNNIIQDLILDYEDSFSL